MYLVFRMSNTAGTTMENISHIPSLLRNVYIELSQR